MSAPRGVTVVPLMMLRESSRNVKFSSKSPSSQPSSSASSSGDPGSVSPRADHWGRPPTGSCMPFLPVESAAPPASSSGSDVPGALPRDRGPNATPPPELLLPCTASVAAFFSFAAALLPAFLASAGDFPPPRPIPFPLPFPGSPAPLPLRVTGAQIIPHSSSSPSGSGQ